MLKFRALALRRLNGDGWQWELCAVYHAHSDDFGGNSRPVDGLNAGHREHPLPARRYEKCGAGELVELFGSGSVTWMFTEERAP